MGRLIVFMTSLTLIAFIIIACDKQSNELMPDISNTSYAPESGYNEYGYNHEAHLYNGTFFNAYAEGAGYHPYQGNETDYLEGFPGASSHWAWQCRNTELRMEWNQAWIACADADSFIGSGAMVTNHQECSLNGVHYTYYAKIVAAEPGYTQSDGYWYDEEGRLVGESIWEEFAIVQEVFTPGGAVFHPARPGAAQRNEVENM